MRFDVARVDLTRELQTVVRAIGARGGMEALGGVLVSATTNGVILAATDGELSVQSSLQAHVEDEGTTLVPGRLLTDVVRMLDDERVIFDCPNELETVTVATKTGRFALRALRPDDFPHLSQRSSSGQLEIPGVPFATTVERVARAASRDETRPVLTGVLISVARDGLRMVATDSYRLSVKETHLENGPQEPLDANVPARAVREVSRLIREREGEQLTVLVDESQIVFGLGGVTVSSRLIDGQFPNYQQLLPDSYEHEVRVGREELLGVVRRVGLMAQRNAPLRLLFEDGSLTISAQTPDVGEGTESIPVEFGGERLEIGFNPQFLQDGLESVEAEDVALKLISSLRPGLIEAPGANGEGRFLYLIMPVRLNV